MVSTVQDAPAASAAAPASDKESFSVLQFLQQEVGQDYDHAGGPHAVPVLGPAGGLHGTSGGPVCVNGVKANSDKATCGAAGVLQGSDQDVVETQGLVARPRDRRRPVAVRSFKDLLFHEECDEHKLTKHHFDGDNKYLFHEPDDTTVGKTVLPLAMRLKQEAVVLDGSKWWLNGDNDSSSCSATPVHGVNTYITSTTSSSSKDTCHPPIISKGVGEDTCCLPRYHGHPQVFPLDYSYHRNAADELDLIEKDFRADYFGQAYVPSQISNSSTLPYDNNSIAYVPRQLLPNSSTLPYDSNSIAYSDIANVTRDADSALAEHYVMKTKEMLIQSLKEKFETLSDKSNYQIDLFKKTNNYHNEKHDNYSISTTNKTNKCNNVVKDKKQRIKFKPKQRNKHKPSNINTALTESNEDNVNNKIRVLKNEISMETLDSDKSEIDSQNSFIMKPESLLSIEDLSEIVKEEIIKDVEDNESTLNLIENQLNKNSYNKEEVILCDTQNETLSSYHENKSDIFMCRVCGYKCKHKDIYENHISSHYSQYSEIYRKERQLHECPVCGYKCRHKSIFRNHMASHKITDAYLKFGCKLCDFRCNFRRSLRQHAINHDSKKMFTCTECDYKNTSTNQFHEHITSTGHKLFKCSVCKETFKCHKDFTEHKQIHPSRKCPECGKLFNSKFRLQRHLQYESEDIQFECKYCKEKSTSRCLHKIHLMSHKNRPFDCSLCDKKFTRIDNLRSHILCHHGQKPFSCPVCNKKYTKKAYLNKHILGHEL